MMKNLLKDELGSPTVETIFWIFIFVGTMVAAMNVFVGQIQETMDVSGDVIVSKYYDDYCESLNIGKDYWDGKYFPDGGKPNCVATKPTKIGVE